MPEAVVMDLTSVAELQTAVAKGPVVLHFWAPWCDPCKQIDAVLAQLAADAPGLTIGRVQAEEVDALSAQYQVALVPLVVVLAQGGSQVGRVKGADVPAITRAVLDLTGGVATAAAAPPDVQAVVAPTSAPRAVAIAPGSQASFEDLKPQLQQLVSQQPVMVFMKGNPEQPRCGFSRKVVEALQGAAVPFGSFDILQNEAVRQGLKTLSNWPTYPQVYVKGELLGGCDIVLEMQAENELQSSIQAMLQA